MAWLFSLMQGSHYTYEEAEVMRNTNQAKETAGREYTAKK